MLSFHDAFKVHIHGYLKAFLTSTSLEGTGFSIPRAGARFLTMTVPIIKLSSQRDTYFNSGFQALPNLKNIGAINLKVV